MSERILWSEFETTYLNELEQGDIATHFMAFPGVYPGDRPFFDSYKAGNVRPPHAKEYLDLLHGLQSRGVHMHRLRTLPTPGTFGYDKTDVAAMLEISRYAASNGEDVRWVPFAKALRLFIKRCGQDSPIVRSMVLGAEIDEPHKSLWIVRRRKTGNAALSLTFVGVMDYANDAFLGLEPHNNPTDPDIVRYAQTAIDIHALHATPVTPL